MTLGFRHQRRKLLFLAFLTITAPAQADDLAGCLAMVAKDPDQAQAVASVWLRRDPQSHDAMQCRAAALFSVGDFTAAAVQFGRLARLTAAEKPAAVFYDKAAWGYMRAKQNAAAEQEIINAITHDPQNPLYRQDHAVALMNAERYWDAVRELDPVIKLNPRAVDALATRADCWLKLGQGSRAKHDAKRVLEIQPNHELAQAVVNKLLSATDGDTDDSTP